MAIVYGDCAKLDALLHATPRPDLTARDELGNSLLGLATSMAIADGGSMRDIESLRLLLAAGARPMREPAGSREALIEMVAQVNDARRRRVLEMLLDAGLGADAPTCDKRSVLFHQFLTPDAARLLLAHGIDRQVHDTRGCAADSDGNDTAYTAYIAVVKP